MYASLGEQSDLFGGNGEETDEDAEVPQHFDYYSDVEHNDHLDGIEEDNEAKVPMEFDYYSEGEPNAR